MNGMYTINVTSGKGGTGKTLFCSLLAELLGNKGIPVLLIDLDFFVRGLTALLYFHRQEAFHLVEKNQITVSDLFVKKNNVDNKYSHELGISRYRSFDVLPSVSRIDELLNYNDIMPNDKDEAISMLKKMFSMIPRKYEIVILDCRAGYDELISAAHICSDMTLCIEEEDNISKVTSDNLLKQLGNDSKTPLLRLTNKARNIETARDLEDAKRSINEIGPIPFDMDVMKNFGKEMFWEVISKSLYKAAVVDSWNRLCKKMSLKYVLTDSRISPLASNTVEKMFSLFGGSERVFLFYGILLSAIGFGLALSGEKFFYLVKDDPTRSIGFVSGVLGFFMIVGVLLKGKK